MRLRLGLLAAALLALPGIGRADVIDLMTAGANNGPGGTLASIGGTFLVQQIPNQSSGTGVIDSFVRIHQTGTESGYNTDLGTPLNDLGGIFTHALTIADVPVVNIGGTAYRQFMLDINQDHNMLLSLNQIQIFVSTTGDRTDDGIVQGVDPTHAPIIGFGAGSSEVFRMSGQGLFGTVGHEIQMNYALNSGSGSGDMFLYVLDSIFTDFESTANVILYSQFGAPPGAYESNDGFEEWAVLRGPGDPAVPAPAGVVLFALGSVLTAGYGWRRNRRLKLA